MKSTNFDQYLGEQIKDPEFAARFEQAGEAWDIALQLTALRHKAGLSTNAVNFYSSNFSMFISF